MCNTSFHSQKHIDSPTCYDFTPVANPTVEGLGKLGREEGNKLTGEGEREQTRNPSLAKQSFGYAILGFALTEAIALFAPMMAFLILFVF
ncbi:hypothetical protein HID58_006155 [Brassica napus]|uniref:V-ATPase proteolipid subunit C-like domain-containing protein n=1 Tax=Brassica napus TaxID=3708 RepID=A0ABQ8EAP0_BRANA|nr:hypothetical protein HID58_006155 [Brassica napus]